MNELLNQKGKVSVIIGDAYLSLYEIKNLQIDNIIMTKSICGKPYTLLFNNNFLCKGEVVVLKDILGFRVSQIDNKDLPLSLIGAVDNIIELLPIHIRIAEVEYSLGQLKNIACSSVISLDKKFTHPVAVELITGGIPIASGELIVYHENYGIKIKKIHFKINDNINIRSSGNLYKPQEIKVKNYDLTRPDIFSWDNIIKLKNIHNYFIEYLKLIFPETKQYEVLITDQLAFYELFNEMEKNYTFIKIINEFRPNGHLYSNEKLFLKKNNNILSLLEPINPKYPLDNETKTKISEFINNRNHELNSFLIGFKKTSIFSNIKNKTGYEEFILNPLRNAWKNIVYLNLKFISRTSNNEEKKFIFNKDMICYIKIGIKDNPENDLILIYPYLTLEPIIYLLE